MLNKFALNSDCKHNQSQITLYVAAYCLKNMTFNS